MDFNPSLFNLTVLNYAGYNAGFALEGEELLATSLVVDTVG